MLYYYFVNNKKIVGFPVPVDLAMNVGFVPLTEEQKSFYLEHPNASIQEVKDCQLISSYIPPTPDIEEYVAMKVKELKSLCYGSVTVSSLEYSVALACVNGTSLIYTGDKYYTVLQAKNIIKQFMDESYKALTVYNNYKPQIESAQSIEAVDALMEQATEALNEPGNSKK